MSSATLELVLVAGVAFALIAGLTVSALVPLVLRASAEWAPASRHRALVAIGFAPLALTSTALIAIMLPSLFALFWPAYDHCLVHGGHAHLCWAHPAAHLHGGVGRLLMFWALAAAALTVASALLELLRARQVIGRLFAATRFDPTRGAWIAPTSAMLCLSAGLFRPRICLSEGLLEDASERDLEVMLAHERAHGRRRDNLVRLCLRFTTRSMLPNVRHALFFALDLAAEQACDEEAARHVGDRLDVAETLLTMERRMNGAVGPRAPGLSLAFGSHSVPNRIGALLEPPRVAAASGWVVGGVAATALVILASFSIIHHATESALALVLL